MPVTALLHSEWIKIRSVRASYGSLLAVFVSTLAITLLVFATVGRAEADNGGDTVFNAFYVINFAQIAAISFGATAVSSEYTGGALRVSLSAVPHRSRFYASKIAVMAVAALAAGLAAGSRPSWWARRSWGSTPSASANRARCGPASAPGSI